MASRVRSGHMYMQISALRAASVFRHRRTTFVRSSSASSVESVQQGRVRKAVDYVRFRQVYEDGFDSCLVCRTVSSISCQDSMLATSLCTVTASTVSIQRTAST